VPVQEIEVPGSSISMKVFGIPDHPATPVRILATTMVGDDRSFAPATERPGFHDLDHDNAVLRGHFSQVVPFEVEHLVDGVTTKSLYKRIESCEWVLLNNHLVAWGNSGPVKELASAMSRVLGIDIRPVEWTTEQLQDLQGRMTQVRAVALTQGKDKPIRKARLAGVLEEDDYLGIVEPGNHGIDSVTGIIETPAGPATLAVARKGGVRWRVRKGTVLSVVDIQWLVDLMASFAGVPTSERLDARIQQRLRGLDKFMKDAGCRVEFSTGDGGPPAVLGVGSKIGGGGLP